MENKIEQFLKKLRELPKEVDIFFSSDFNVNIIDEFFEDYEIEDDLVNDFVFDFFASNFNVTELYSLISQNFSNKEIADKFICDFLGKFFIPVEPLIEQDISSAIKKYKGNPLDYKEYIKGFNDLIEDQNISDLADTLEVLEENFSPEEEEALVINFLEKDLRFVLEGEDASGPQKINGSLIYLVKNKKESLSRFIKAFMANQEKLGSKKIIINGKEVEPTVANWLKHFIAQNGSGLLSSIVLAKYLSSSEVSALLNENERRTLRKILKTYNNLVFFPDSMKNIPMSDWQILPVEKNIEEDKIGRLVKNSKPIENIKVEEKKTPVIKEVKIEEKILPKELPVENIIPHINLAEQELDVLQKLLLKYPNKSLERKAIEGEIKKRKK